MRNQDKPMGRSHPLRAFVNVLLKKTPVQRPRLTTAQKRNKLRTFKGKTTTAPTVSVLQPASCRGVTSVCITSPAHTTEPVLSNWNNRPNLNMTTTLRQTQHILHLSHSRKKKKKNQDY